MDVKEEMKEDPENNKKSEPEAPEDVAMKPSTILRTSGPSPTPAASMAITEANFKEVAWTAMNFHLEACGGPVQYLKRELGSPGNSKWKDFAEQLQVAFPRRTDLSYLESLELPRGHDPSETFRVSLWQLGFVECCSSKPMTFRVTAAALADEYLTNTCLTAQEPLLLYQQPLALGVQIL